MKSLFFFITGVFLSTGVFGQVANLYNPKADARQEIADAVAKAGASGKHVFLQIGGNWCPWCIKFHNFVDDDKELKSYVDQNFVVVHVNYSPENKNTELLSQLGYPQRFGFPVFVILDGKGKQIHTQNSGFLEKGESYDKKTVLQFFKNWSPAALDPASYK